MRFLFFISIAAMLISCTSIESKGALSDEGAQINVGQENPPAERIDDFGRFLLPMSCQRPIYPSNLFGQEIRIAVQDVTLINTDTIYIDIRTVIFPDAVFNYIELYIPGKWIDESNNFSSREDIRYRVYITKDIRDIIEQKYIDLPVPTTDGPRITCDHCLQICADSNLKNSQGERQLFQTESTFDAYFTFVKEIANLIEGKSQDIDDLFEQLKKSESEDSTQGENDLDKLSK